MDRGPQSSCAWLERNQLTTLHVCLLCQFRSHLQALSWQPCLWGIIKVFVGLSPASRARLSSLPIQPLPEHGLPHADKRLWKPILFSVGTTLFILCSQ